MLQDDGFSVLAGMIVVASSVRCYGQQATEGRRTKEGRVASGAGASAFALILLGKLSLRARKASVMLQIPTLNRRLQHKVMTQRREGNSVLLSPGSNSH